MRASILAEVNHEVEISQSAVVEVGNRREIRMRCEIVGEQHHLVHQFGSWAFLAQSADVVCIHGNDTIESAKILGCHRARMMGECVATRCGLLAHAMIREFSFVIVYHSCRINGRKVRNSTSRFNFLAKNFFGQRRTADVAKANKKDLHKRLVSMCLNAAQRYEIFLRCWYLSYEKQDVYLRNCDEKEQVLWSFCIFVFNYRLIDILLY